MAYGARIPLYFEMLGLPPLSNEAVATSFSEQAALANKVSRLCLSPPPPIVTGATAVLQALTSGKVSRTPTRWCTVGNLLSKVFQSVVNSSFTCDIATVRLIRTKASWRPDPIQNQNQKNNYPQTLAFVAVPLFYYELRCRCCGQLSCR